MTNMHYFFNSPYVMTKPTTIMVQIWLHTLFKLHQPPKVGDFIFIGNNFVA